MNQISDKNKKIFWESELINKLVKLVLLFGFLTAVLAATTVGFCVFWISEVIKHV